MGISGIWQWLVVLLLVVLIFGTKKLKNVGQDLGEAVKGFKKGLKDDEQASEVQIHQVIDEQKVDSTKVSQSKDS